MVESDLTGDVDDLMRTHLPIAMRIAVRLTGNLHDAEDVVQEALLRAARSISTFRQDASFRTWLTRILINVHRSRLSATSISTSVLDESQCGSGSPSAEHELESTESQQQIMALVNQLPPRQKEVLVLMTWEDHSATEVAEVLGITIQNVYSNLNAARSSLKASLETRGRAADSNVHRKRP